MFIMRYRHHEDGRKKSHKTIEQACWELRMTVSQYRVSPEDTKLNIEGKASKMIDVQWEEGSEKDETK